MLAIGSLLVLGGLIGIVVTIIGLIIHKVSKSETKVSLKPLCISIGTFVLGLILVPTGGSTSNKTASVPASPASPENSLPAGFTADTRFDPRSPGGAAVLSVVRDRCHRLVDGNSDLEEARFTHIEAADPEFANYGRQLPFVPDGLDWNVVERLTISVKDDADGKSLSEAKGNVCEFDFGGGSKPGILTSKSVCASLCRGLPEGDRGNYFGDEPRLQVIEPAATAKKADTERVASNIGELKQLERKARGGDYQARRNLAYRYQQGDFSAQPDYVTACAWREIILDSGGEQVDASDISNRDFACGRMPAGSEGRVKALKKQFNRG